jgi:hypothetical protein
VVKTDFLRDYHHYYDNFFSCDIGRGQVAGQDEGERDETDFPEEKPWNFRKESGKNPKGLTPVSVNRLFF